MGKRNSSSNNKRNNHHPHSKEQHQLRQRRRHETLASARNDDDDNHGYEALVRKYSRPIPRQSLLRCCSESLPVVQEFSLSVFFLARYQLSALWEAKSSNGSSSHLDTRRMIETRLDWAHGCILAGFLLVIAFRFQKQETLMKNTRTKARHRLTDACLLGVLLRLLASVLRRLTASYSSDTVEALTMACMGLHLLTCDYTYSSGRNENVSSTITRSQGDDGKNQNRPPFQGGTVSLNASFFATVLCISRLESDLTSYFFCSLAVIFFGFYPQTRADLMAEYPPHQSGTKMRIIQTHAVLVTPSSHLARRMLFMSHNSCCMVSHGSLDFSHMYHFGRRKDVWSCSCCLAFCSSWLAICKPILQETSRWTLESAHQSTAKYYYLIVVAVARW